MLVRCSTIAVMILVLTSVPALGAPEPAVQSPEAELRYHLQQLDLRLQEQLAHAERRAAAGQVPAFAERASAAIRRHLEHLEAQVQRGDFGAAAPWLDRLRALERLTGELERSVRLDPATAAARVAHRRRLAPPAAPRPKTIEPPANDTCDGALPVELAPSAGSTLGAGAEGGAFCGSSELSPDVWHRLTAPVDGFFYATTAGSSFDTVLSVLDGCPADGGSELACDDNALGLQSTLGFFAEAGQDYFLRVSGFVGAAGGYQLSVGAGGIVTGIVRDAVNGQPLPFVRVELSRLEGFGFGSAQTDATGTYRIDGLAPGRYGALAFPTGNFVAQVFGGGSCFRDRCDPTRGTPITVDAAGVTAGIDFALERGGRVTGTVRDATTGEPIVFAAVTVWRRDELDQSVASVGTDGAGGYAVEGLLAGSYVATASAFDHRIELFSELPCAETCNLATGGAIEVALGATRAGVDFTLERGGTVAGRVVDAVTGAPIEFADVVIYDLQGSAVRSTSADFDGVYAVGGLAPGSYFVAAATFELYLAEVYDGLACRGGDLSDCDVTAGQQVAVRVATTTAGIDFTLDPQGSIAGRVVDAGSGEPIAGARVVTLPVDGNVEADGFSDADGNYRVEGVEPGGQHVQVLAEGYLAELWDDVACSVASFGGFDCPLDAAMVIEVGLSGSIGGIDFDLVRLGTIEGRVVDAVSGQPLAGATVNVFSPDRTLLRSATTDDDGRYRAEGLAGGGYRVVATSDRHQGELYDGLPCPDSSCNVAAGSNVQVANGQTTQGIDFSLAPWGDLAGRVTDRGTGAGLADVVVQLVTTDGAIFDSTTSDGTGRYRFTAVAPGSYRVWARAQEPHLPELYDGVVCLDLFSPRCDVAAAESVEVRLAETTEDVDFALLRGAMITGSVRAAVGGEALAGLGVQVWDDTGRLARFTSTDPNGRWDAGGLPTGRYFATSDGGLEFADELYRDLPCPEFACTPSAGTPIDVVAGATRTGIDFTLDRPGHITGKVSDARSGAGIAGGSVLVWDATGALVAVTGTDASGRYDATGLRPGSYTIAAFAGEGFLGELFPDLRCPQGVCDPTLGQPITVAFDTTVSGIDFALDVGAAITGTVTDAFRREPAGFVILRLWDAQGVEIRVAFGDAFGRYAFLGLEPGTYFVSTNGFGVYRDEVWDGVVCGDFCVPTAGTPLVLELPGQVIGSIDFDLVPQLGPGCGFGEPLLCLNGDRFKVTARWRDFTGASAQAQSQQLTGDSGYFWFFDQDNVEVVVKVIDACTTADPRFWVFAAGLTNVEVELEVEDTLTGDVKTYQNVLGEPFRPILDTEGFTTCGPGLRAGVQPPRDRELEKLFGDCQSDALGLCLNDGRFRVEAFFETFQGTTGQGRAVELTADSGYFWFFDDANVEVVVKVLDACTTAEPRFWVFAAGLTNVEVLLRVTDTETGAVREYRNPLARAFQPVLDTGAFATCEG